MKKSFIYNGNYKHLKHQELKIRDTQEHIVWIYKDKALYYRCYGLPQTINFCEKLLSTLKEKKSLREIQLDVLSNKEKLLIQNLMIFLKHLS